MRANSLRQPKALCVAAAGTLAPATMLTPQTSVRSPGSVRGPGQHQVRPPTKPTGTSSLRRLSVLLEWTTSRE